MRQKSKESDGSDDRNNQAPSLPGVSDLCIGFIVAPFLAGLDKFTYVLMGWDHYVARVVAGLSEEFAGTHGRELT
jgi:hypothetical protein